MEGRGTRIEDIYPSWTDVLPLLIKGFIFPPIARLLLHAYERTKRIRYLQTSIRYSLATLAATDIDHPSRPYYQSRLAEVLFDRSTVTGSKMDLRLAQQLQESVIPLVEPDDKYFSWHRYNLHLTYQARYRMSGKMEDLDLDINFSQSTIDLFPLNSKSRASWLRTLAYMLHTRGNTSGRRQDADAEFDAANVALNCVVDEYRSLTYKTLASAHQSRFQHTGDREDLDLALKWGLASLEASDSKKVSRGQLWQDLCNTYLARYSRFDELRDLEEATAAGLKCVEEAKNQSDMGVNYQTLARCYTSRYGRLGRDKDLEEAFKWAYKAWNDETGSPTYRGVYAHGLSQLYVFAYHKAGDVEALESAVKWGETAVRSTRRGVDRTPHIHANYADALQWRYHRYRNRKDLDLATKYVNLSIEATPKGDVAIHIRRELLVSLLRSHYYLQKDFNTVQTALEIQESIVEATPSTHSRASARYRNLAVLHEMYYHAGGPRRHRDDAMRWIRAAVDASPPNDPNRPGCLGSLIRRYSDRYIRLRDPNDLEEAIKAGEELRTLIPPNHPNYALHFSVLADVYADRWGLLHEPGDRDTAMQLFRQICKMENTDSGLLWMTMRRWVAFTTHMGKDEQLEAFHVGYRILPELFWLGNDMTSRHETLVRYELDTFTAQAIRCCMHHEALEGAIEFLEQSLALTFQQLLDLRMDLGELKERYPDHASQLEGVSRELLGFAGSSSVEIDRESIDRSEWDRQRKLAHERSALLKTIRDLPGFEHFLKPLGFEELKAVADHGPVIILNSSAYMCDAIVMFPGGKLVRIPLHGVNTKDVAKQCTQLKLALGRFGIQARGQHILEEDEDEEDADEGPLRDSRAVRRPRNDPNIAINLVLAWTWTMFVEPIYKVLAENGITSGRIWWCPTGPVSSLPLHAAGPPSAYVPSYTSTLGALLRARNRAVVSAPANVTVQAIGITETMNATLNKLPQVGVEINVVAQAAGADRTTVLMDNEATFAQVTDLLPRATWLHLACHGQQGDASEPLKSGLLLYDNSKLELEKIIKTDIPDASFVFLSACETAMGDGLMSGESLHLAGGMVFAGFKAVIGTLWSIHDDDGPVVAKTVYEHVFGEGKEPDVYKTAEALHLAVQGLRASGVAPHRWVPFIHIGV